MSNWHAFAKLTLSLRVLQRRVDGFHDLDALTVSVSEPHDDVRVELGGGRGRGRGNEGVTFELSGPAAGGVDAGPDNLAARAAQAVLDRAGDAARDAGVRIALHKRIPAGAGLGGGSADAAAVLVALDRLLALETPIAELAAMGAALGSDVPFCLRGGAAHMRGRGEIIEPTTVPPLYVLIAVPRFAIGTPAVYRAWDDLDGPVSTREVPGPIGLATLTNGLATLTNGLATLTNDLESAAERVEPRLVGFRTRLERAAGTPAILAGSGSACAVLYDDEAAAAAARERVIAANIAPTCVVGVTRPTGVEPATEEP